MIMRKARIIFTIQLQILLLSQIKNQTDLKISLADIERIYMAKTYKDYVFSTMI